jgi:hypothetical protein
MGRLTFLGVTLFWVVMNLLLWRREFGGGSSGGTPVSVDVVVEKLLTSPDPSTLELKYQGKTAGFLHWYPDPGEETQEVYSEGYIPQGMVGGERSLEVRLEGNLTPPSGGAGLRLDVVLRLGVGRDWETVSIQGGNRQLQLKIGADRALGELTWYVKTPEMTLEDRVLLSEDRDTREFLGMLGVGAEPFLSLLPLDSVGGNGAEWSAELGWIPFGNSRIRVYRLRGRWQGGYEVALLVNRAGEVLRVELPGGVRLFNEGLVGF